MTHSWPPPLSAIHTPGKAEQSKFPFPNKVRHTTSCITMPPAPQNVSYMSQKCVRSLGWGWCHADDLIHVCPSIPCLFPICSPCRATRLLLSYLLAATLMLACGSWVPRHNRKAKQQVYLVGCPDVVPSVGTGWGPWLAPQGTYSCCESRSSCWHPLLLLHLALLAKVFVETIEVRGGFYNTLASAVGDLGVRVYPRPPT